MTSTDFMDDMEDQNDALEDYSSQDPSIFDKEEVKESFKPKKKIP